VEEAAVHPSPAAQHDISTEIVEESLLLVGQQATTSRKVVLESGDVVAKWVVSPISLNT
jgi:hypothetical protein